MLNGLNCPDSPSKTSTPAIRDSRASHEASNPLRSLVTQVEEISVLTSDPMSAPPANQRASLADYLAAERTLLAWIRTGLALMGFGFVVARFGLFLQEFQVVEHVALGRSTGPSLWFGTVLIVVGVLVNILAGWHHVRLVKSLDRGDTEYSRPSIQPVAIAFFLALVGLAMAIYLLLVRSSTGPHS